MSSHVLTQWEPENTQFWAAQGKNIARQNLWISIPALLLAFSVWMVWSVVVVNLPNVGFTYSTNQLFWLTALPALSGATDNVGAVTGAIAPNGTTDDSTPTFNGSGTPGDVINIYDGANVIGSTTVGGNGVWSFTPTTPLGEGSHSITSTATP